MPRLSGPSWSVANGVSVRPKHSRVSTQFPPRQLAISPIQSSASVGALLTLDESEISERRSRQKARLRRRALEWQKTAEGVGPEVRPSLLGAAGLMYCRLRSLLGLFEIS